MRDAFWPILLLLHCSVSENKGKILIFIIRISEAHTTKVIVYTYKCIQLLVKSNYILQ